MREPENARRGNHAAQRDTPGRQSTLRRANRKKQADSPNQGDGVSAGQQRQLQRGSVHGRGNGDSSQRRAEARLRNRAETRRQSAFGETRNEQNGPNGWIGGAGRQPTGHRDGERRHCESHSQQRRQATASGGVAGPQRSRKSGQSTAGGRHRSDVGLGERDVSRGSARQRLRRHEHRSASTHRSAEE